MAAQNKNISVLDDIISKSTKISSEPHAVYQLRTKKKKFETFTRVTVGETDLKPNKTDLKPNKTILLVGETGTGKSTLINALFNHIMGVTFEDEVWFQIVEEGQPSDVIVYKIFGFEGQTMPYSLTIIDTPGFGDTRGMEHDIKTNQQISQLFRSEKGLELNAVGLVMKATENHVNDRLKLMLDSLMCLFGKDLEKHIIALITHSEDGKQPKKVLQALEDANIKCVRNEKDQPVYFLFNNCQDEERTEDNDLLINYGWRVTQRGMSQFTAFIEKSSPLQLKVMMEEQREQIRLTACIQNLKDRIKFTELKWRDVRKTQETLSNNELEIKKNQGFTVDVPEVYKEKRPITDSLSVSGFETAVFCIICEENCHYPGCSVTLKLEECEVMREGKCTSCTNKCSTSHHLKDTWRYVIRTQKVKKTETEIKEQYKQNQTGNLKKLSFSQSLENQIKQLTAEKFKLVDEVYQHFIKLVQIEDPVTAHVHLDFLMKKMKQKGDLGKLQELKEINSRVDERTRAELQLRKERISAKHEDLISESVLMPLGPPAVYQLVTKKEMFGTLSRVIVGEKDETKTNKTILFVGETGAGKSTLINALFNHIVGVKFEDEVWFQIVEDEGRRQTESQTSDVIVYQIFGFEGQTLPYSLTIVDTPGFGDTRRTQEDFHVSERLFDLFRSKEGVHEIHAVGLVLKASMNRLNERLMTIFNSVMSLFGKDMEKNIITLITNSDGKPPENVFQALESAQIKCIKDDQKQPVYFKFNNQQEKCRGSTENEKTGSKYSWDFTKDEMSRLTDYLKNSKPQPLKTTVEVLNYQIQLKACVENLQDRIKTIELKQQEIKQIQKAIKTEEEKMKRNENFIVEMDEVYKDKEDIKFGMRRLLFFKGALTCPVCEENCHLKCTMAWYSSHCEVMSRGHCTVCTRKCPASVHVKENWKYVTKTRKVKKTYESVKEKYETNKAECENKMSLLENLKEETRNLTTERFQLLDEAYQSVIRLEQIALKVDSLSTYVHLDFLIEKLSEKKDIEKVQILIALKSRMDKEMEMEISSLVLKKTEKMPSHLSFQVHSRVTKATDPGGKPRPNPNPNPQ